MAKINAAWHRTHRLPRNATFDQRVRWYAAHAGPCGCHRCAACSKTGPPVAPQGGAPSTELR